VKDRTLSLPLSSSAGAGERRAAPERTLADRAMERYASGDDAAFAAVYDALSPRIFAYLRSRAGHGTRAEDLLQQTFLCLHRSRGTFVKDSAVLPWALAIARRLLIDDSRRAQRSALSHAQQLTELGAPPSPEPDAVELLSARDLQARVRRELVELPPRQRAAFELVRVEGLSHAQAAEALGVSVNSVKLRAHRAYMALRSALGLER
jgi:RNA polymerase sigma-70 factor, ECF subfamily